MVVLTMGTHFYLTLSVQCAVLYRYSWLQTNPSPRHQRNHQRQKNKPTSTKASTQPAAQGERLEQVSSSSRPWHGPLPAPAAAMFRPPQGQEGAAAAARTLIGQLCVSGRCRRAAGGTGSGTSSSRCVRRETRRWRLSVTCWMCEYHCSVKRLWISGINRWLLIPTTLARGHHFHILEETTNPNQTQKFIR